MPFSMRRLSAPPTHLLVGITITLPALVQAQQGTVQALPEVRVTDTRVQTTPSLTQPGIEAAREAIDRTPGGVDVVDPDTYKTGRSSTVEDALGFSPGVFVQPRFGAEESRLSIRGSGIQRTFHLRGITLLQDGVPLNQADGGGDFQALDPLAVRYIEVWRGANALQYGSTTLGGAINYVSPTGYDWPALQARAEAGSFGYRRGQLSAGGVHGRYDYFISGTTFSQEGYRDHARQDNQRLTTNAGIRITPDLETRFYFTYATSNSELPGNLTKAQMQADPRQANPGNVTLNQRRDYDLTRIANKTVYRFGEQRIEGGVYYAYKTLFHPIFQVLDVDSHDYGFNLRYVSAAKWFGRRNILTVGVVPVYTRQHDDRFVNVNGNRGVRTAQSLQTASNLAAFGEVQHYVTEKAVLVLGAQATRATRKYEDQFLVDGDNGFDKTYSHVSPKAGVRYEITPTTQLFANVSGSFEPPSFGELAGGPNITQVDAQRATTYEIGSRGLNRYLAWDVALYRAQVRDELLSLNSPTGQPLGTVNAPKTLHQGIELGATVSYRGFEWRNAYLYNDFRFEDNASFGNNRLPGIPRQFLRSELLYRVGEGYYVDPNVTWSPDRYPVDMANTLYADSYALLGLRFGRQIAKGLSWFVDARNLTDKKYASSTGVIADARGLDSAQFLPGDGRSVYAGVEWKM